MTQTVTERELRSQSDQWQAVLARAADFDLRGRVDLGGFDEVVLFGSGSSYYLAMAAGDCLEARVGARVRVLPSCDLLLYEQRYIHGAPARTLAIGFSRSGESSEAVLAARLLIARGHPVMAVGCEAESSLMRLAQHTILVPEGREDGFVMMRSFTCMLLAVQLAALWATEGAVPTALARLPTLGREVLARAAVVREATRGIERFVFLGSGPHAPLALEAALKLQESAGVTTEAYRTLEYRHGPRATGGPGTLAVLFDPAVGTYGPDLVRDLRRQGLGVMVIGDELEAYLEADYRVALASGLADDLSAPLAMLPVHLLALETASRLGRDPDRPENLAKVVIFGNAST